MPIAPHVAAGVPQGRMRQFTRHSFRTLLGKFCSQPNWLAINLQVNLVDATTRALNLRAWALWVLSLVCESQTQEPCRAARRVSAAQQGGPSVHK